MVEQPSGTVTLVFTDIEGSTRLLHELGERAYREALAEHRRVVREACGPHGGYEVDYEGDSFFYAFGSARAAVAAIDQAMRGLAEGPIRLRVGIHTGEPGLDPPKYVGLDVHRAARVMAAAHGGQILLSAATAALIREELPPGLKLRDLGEHRLKDLKEPVRLYQIAEEALLRPRSPSATDETASAVSGRVFGNNWERIGWTNTRGRRFGGLIRAATPADAEAVARVHVRTWQVAYAHVFSPERLAKVSVEGSAAQWREWPPLVAEIEGIVVGFVSVGASSGGDADGELFALYVDPDDWGSGIGRALITAGEQRLRDLGHRDATLWVMEDNPRARRFYERAGWYHDLARRSIAVLDLEVPEMRYRKQINQ